jgi:hypothetical protein
VKALSPHLLLLSTLLLVACSDTSESVVDEDISDEELGTETTDEGVTDEGVTDEGVTDEGTDDEGVTDEGVTDEGTDDEGVTDEGVTDEGVTDEGVTDEGVTGTVLGSLPGNTCQNPLLVDSLPFSHSADSNAYTDDYSLTGQCEITETAGVGSGDVVYQLDAFVSGEHVIQIDSDGGPNSVFVAVDCENLAASCLHASGLLIPGKFWSVSLNAGNTYFVVVDGWQAGSQGIFKLTIHGPCVPLCKGKLCGSDGCGGVCGKCKDSKICSLGKCISFDPSCKDACGQYIPGATCQCDAGCFDSEDDGCCPDLCTYCENVFTEQCAPKPSNGSCTGLCGLFVEGADCQCDAGCFGLDDCCIDICQQCGATHPEQCKDK